NKVAGAARQQPRISSVTIGIGMAAALFAITFLAFNKGLPFVHGFRLHAIVQDSKLLRSGSPVRIAGVDVGEVSDVTPGPGETSVQGWHASALKRGAPLHHSSSHGYATSPGSSRRRTEPLPATSPRSSARPRA